jgi:hypothetical protein
MTLNRHNPGSNGAKIASFWDVSLSRKGQKDSARSFNPINANLTRDPFDGRMAFVPEGHADRSQAQSAWVAMQRTPVPEGRSKSWSVPEIFVVETEFMPV